MILALGFGFLNFNRRTARGQGFDYPSSPARKIDLKSGQTGAFPSSTTSYFFFFAFFGRDDTSSTSSTIAIANHRYRHRESSVLRRNVRGIAALFEQGHRPSSTLHLQALLPPSPLLYLSPPGLASPPFKTDAVTPRRQERVGDNVSASASALSLVATGHPNPESVIAQALASGDKNSCLPAPLVVLHREET